jgi:hypothetical protein
MTINTRITDTRITNTGITNVGPLNRGDALSARVGALARKIDTTLPTALAQHARRTRGAAAEQRFRDWLDRCHLPHLYVEQSPLTFPRGLREVLKRPDFLIGVPTVGTIAVDVKSKRIYDHHLIIDAEEHASLLIFETSFNIPVWFAAFPPDGGHTCHLFCNRQLATLPDVMRKSKTFRRLPLRSTHIADDRRDFIAALMSAIRHR